MKAQASPTNHTQPASIAGTAADTEPDLATLYELKDQKRLAELKACQEREKAALLRINQLIADIQIANDDKLDLHKALHALVSATASGDQNAIAGATKGALLTLKQTQGLG